MDYRGTVADAVSDNEINDLQANEITAPKFAVNRKFEQRQIAEIASEFQPSTNGSDLLWQQRTFLAIQSSLVPRYALRFDGGEIEIGHEFSSIHPSHS